MIKPNQKPVSTKFFTPEHRWLIASTAISAAFVIFVATATSLGFYTIPHAIVVLISLVVLFAPKVPKSLFYVALTLSVIAALAAIFLTLGFANYYEQYIESTH